MMKDYTLRGMEGKTTLEQLRASVESFRIAIRESDNIVFTYNRATRTVYVDEDIASAFESGYKEVTLLGQNVDSYYWVNPDNTSESINFAQLLEMVALISPQLRVRFSTSHPKDMGNGVLYTMAMYPNICNHIHLPVQSGSNAMLEKMNRKYTVERYLERIAKIREILPDCAITTDIIAGFCDETLEDHQQTLDLMEKAGLKTQTFTNEDKNWVAFVGVRQ